MSLLTNLKQQLTSTKPLYLRIKVTARAPKTEIRKILTDGTIKINIQAPPVHGRANQELIKFLSQELEIPSQSISILNGAASALKLLKIS